MNTITAHRPFLAEDEMEAVRQVLASGWLGMGAVTELFESRLAEMLGVKHVIAVNSCTSALHLALASLELDSSDEVIVPSFTFPGTVQAIVAAGARPVFCDIKPNTLNTDLDHVLDCLTSRTRALLPVHMGGQPCDMGQLMALANQQGLYVIEDAAHAFGSLWRGKPVGAIGDATCFSFDPIKNITCGQGGAITTNNDLIANRVRTMRSLGMDRSTQPRDQESRYWHYEVNSLGFRYHMNDFNAAIGLVQLDRFDEFQARRRSLVCRYDQEFAGITGLALLHRDIEEICPFNYVVRVLYEMRDSLIEHLRQYDILPHVHFLPNHLQPFWFEPDVSLPVTEQVADEVISLPLHCGLSDEEQKRVIDLVCSFFQSAVPTPVCELIATEVSSV